MQVILLANQVGSLDAERARRAAQMARELGIKVSLVWVGEAAVPPPELMDLVAATGGAAALLGNDPHACRAIL